MFIEALSQIGFVDVISFVKIKDIHFKGCNLIYANDILDDLDSIRTKLKRLFYFKNINSLFPLNRKKESVVDFFYKKKHYDFVACRYIDEMVLCGLTKYINKLIIDIDDSPESVLRMRAQKSFFIKKIYLMVLEKSIDRIVRRTMDQAFCSFYSNILEAPCKTSIYLHNITISEGNVDDITKDTPYNILMVGWMDYFPNKCGAIHFAEKIFPYVKRNIPQAEFHIVGKVSDVKLKDKLNKISGVKSLGYVEDVTQEYKDCRIVVVPVYQGSGTSVKVIEALRMNRPVISTPIGVRGIDGYLKKNIDYLKAENDEEFIAYSCALLESNERKLNKMAHNGRDVSNKYFSKSLFFDKVKNSIINKSL